MGGLAGALVFVCYLLPYTTACLLGAAVWGFIMYVSWQVGLAAAALLLLFYFLPTTALCLLGAASWFLVFIILPRIVLLLTELTVGTYYMPFNWPFLHVVLLCVLLSNLELKALIPMGILCTVLYFFPRIVLSLLGLFVAWMLWPLLRQGREILLKLIEAPYGEGTMPDKIKNSEEAAEIAHAGKTHYEVLNAHRGASPAELKACYKRLALLLHPDKNPHESAAAAFKKVSDAFTVLGDPCERAEYDAATDNGAAIEEGAVDEDGTVRPPDDMPQGPPGLKKRKARPPGARGRR